MSALAIGLVLAVIASVALNLSYMLQHVGSVHAPAVDARRPIATLRGLLSSRLWVIGGVLGVTGWMLHIAALSHAPLSLVQAFVAGTLGLMAPVAARLLRQNLDPIEWVAVATVAFALILLSVGMHGHHRHHPQPNSARLLVFVVAALLVAGGLAAFARTWRAHALGLAGGILYGASDTAIKALTSIAARHGAVGVLASPWLAAAAVTTICAFFAFQRGLQTGRAIPVVVLMTGATTVVSVGGGFAIFGDPLGRTPLLATLHALAFILVTIGSALLAPAAQAPERALEPRARRPDLVPSRP